MNGDVDALVVQGGPAPWEPDGNIADLSELLETELSRETADLVVLSELALTPYFPASQDRSWLNAGHPLTHCELGRLAQLASRHEVHLVVSFAERDDTTDRLHNSVMIIDASGQPVTGRYCTGNAAGQATQVFRKIHLSENNNTAPGVHEKYFFTPGDGFVVFETALGRIGPLICYDRSFPESWRAVADAGAQIVPVPIATARPERVRMLVSELSVSAAQNGVFVLAACKAGTEASPEGSVTYSGGSTIISPLGTTIAEAPLNQGPSIIRARLERSQLADHARTFHYRRDRRLDAYAVPADAIDHYAIDPNPSRGSDDQGAHP